MKIISRADAKAQGLTRYFTGTPCKRGHVDERHVGSRSCATCQRGYSAGYATRHHGRKLKGTADWRRRNRDKVIADGRARVAEWQRQNPEKVAARNKRWKSANPGAVRAQDARRRAAELQRTPAWADHEAIRFFYDCRPADCHVDHVIPLQGEAVSGLHTVENLQWLPASLNMSKGNRYVEA